MSESNPIHDFAVTLGSIPDVVPTYTIEHSADQLLSLARDGFPQNHIRTGFCKESLTSKVNGKSLRLKFGAKYAVYILDPRPFPKIGPYSWWAVLEKHVEEKIESMLGGGDAG